MREPATCELRGTRQRSALGNNYIWDCAVTGKAICSGRPTPLGEGQAHHTATVSDQLWHITTGTTYSLRTGSAMQLAAAIDNLHQGKRSRMSEALRDIEVKYDLEAAMGVDAPKMDIDWKRCELLKRGCRRGWEHEYGARRTLAAGGHSTPGASSRGPGRRCRTSKARPFGSQDMVWNCEWTKQSLQEVQPEGPRNVIEERLSSAVYEHKAVINLPLSWKPWSSDKDGRIVSFLMEVDDGLVICDAASN